MNSDPKVLVWIIHEGNRSGANLALLEHFQLLQQLNYQLKVISPASGSFTRQLQNQGISVFIIPFYPWTRALAEGFFRKDWFRRFLRNSYASLQMIRIIRGAYAVCTNTICTQLGLVAARLSLKQHLLFVHEYGEEDHGFKLAVSTPLAYRLLYRFSKKVVLNSQAVYQKWERIVGKRDKLAILYNCVNPPANFSPAVSRQKPRLPKFLMLGQISEGKGHRLAIEVIEALPDSYQPVELHIIGKRVNENYYDQLQILARLSKAKIILKPPVEDPYEIFDEYTALLMCSRKEAFGRVTVEALQSGLPVIGLNSGGTPEIIQHGINGFLVGVDQKKDFIYYLETLLNMDSKDYEQLTKHAIRVRNKFSRDISRRQLRDIFKSLN